ncbi:RNA polymerase sigma factor [Desulfotomaculum sp. 1211_IL3151]|uniref:RNA polymerase sigma factor n=1 Tax=Desulfotomaculum sp. 1211_IL3151 TaxID=3084055 RepID=UPI002FD8938F
MLTNEANLVSRAAQDTSAFVELYDFYFPRIYNYIRFRVGDPDVADDLTSQVFERVVHRLKDYQENLGSFAAWIFTIAHNRVTDHYREKQRRSTVSLEAVQEIAADSDVEKDAITTEIKKHLRQALNQLADRERNIISLKFWSGLTNRRIAQLTGISENNVAIILYRSMRKLRAELQDRGVTR